MGRPRTHNATFWDTGHNSSLLEVFCGCCCNGIAAGFVVDESEGRVDVKTVLVAGVPDPVEGIELIYLAGRRHRGRS